MLEREVHGLAAVRRLRDDFDVGGRGQYGPYARADHRFVIRQQNSDHGSPPYLEIDRSGRYFTSAGPLNLLLAAAFNRSTPLCRSGRHLTSTAVHASATASCSALFSPYSAPAALSVAVRAPL